MKYSYAYTVEKEHPWAKDGFNERESFLALQFAIATSPKAIFELGNEQKFRLHHNNEVYIITSHKIRL